MQHFYLFQTVLNSLSSQNMDYTLTECYKHDLLIGLWVVLKWSAAFSPMHINSFEDEKES